MPLFYHGTTVGNLTELKPFASLFSNLKQACVYLSANKPLATVYIWSKPYKWMTFEIKQDGTPVYKESFPDSLKEFYGGVKGFIYTCEGDFSTDNATGIRHAAVSEEPVPVIGCDVVDNAYERMLRYEKEGKMILRRFGDLTQEEQKSNNQMVLGAIRRLNLPDGNHPLSPFVKEKFPELWERYCRQTDAAVKM